MKDLLERADLADELVRLSRAALAEHPIERVRRFFGMKTNTSLVIAMVVLSIFASNAFAVLRSPYPSKPSPPDHIITIIIIGQDRHDLVRTTHRESK